jgi:DNA-binding GntR family transcriptional regulator
MPPVAKRRTMNDSPDGAEATEASAERGASVESIAQDIATAIVEKRLPPGTWLREEALGRVYAVSRTKIRAALLTLAKDKLVETVPDKGSFVSQPSVQEAREVFAVRRLLEAEVVRLVVARAAPADYDRLLQHIAVERSTLKTPASGAVREKLLGDFHVALAEISGQKVLTELVTELVARSSLIAMLYQSHNDPHCSSDEHAQFLALCRRGDADAAVAEMLAHLSRVEASLNLDDPQRDRQLDLVKALLM